MQEHESGEVVPDFNLFADKVAASLLLQMKPTIPLSIDLWDTKIVGAYLKRSERVVSERISKLHSFPAAVRLPVTGATKREESISRPHLLWRARDVIKWVDQHIAEK